MKELSTCPVCKSDRIGLTYRGRTLRKPEDPTVWAVFQCADCDHGFINPQPSWEELQAYYDESYDPYEDSHGVDSFEAELAKARALGELRHVRITPGMNLLDVGCGGGVFLKLARELGANVQGVEPSPHGAATARRAGIPVFNGTLDAFLAENREARFDLITANHVVEHHPDPVALLTQMRAALSTGGKIWFSVPNAGSSGALSLRWRWHSCDLPYHLMQFTPKSVREAAKKADLEIKDLRTLSYAEHVLHSMLHTWRRRWKIPVRLMQRLPILPFARRRAHTMDSECTGEAILCELAL